MRPIPRPPEFQIAEQYLANKDPRKAAQTLLASSERAHPAVKELLSRIASQLVIEAKEGEMANARLRAAECLELAARCCNLTPADEALRLRLAVQREPNAPDQPPTVPTIETQPPASKRESNMHGASAPSLESSVPHDEWQTCVSEPPAMPREASNVAAPPRVAQTSPQFTISPFACRVLGDVDRGLLLSGLDAFGDVLVLTRPHILIGTPRERSVDFPIIAGIHRRHALMVRETDGGSRDCWRIIPLGSASILVNGVSIVSPASRRLADNDVIQLDSGYCRWRFRQPVVDSATVVMEVIRPNAAGVTFADGTNVNCVVLVADRLVISRHRHDSHLTQNDLPGKQIVLQPTSDGWHASSADLSLVAESPQVPSEIAFNTDCRVTEMQHEPEERSNVRRTTRSLQLRLVPR